MHELITLSSLCYFAGAFRAHLLQSHQIAGALLGERHGASLQRNAFYFMEPSLPALAIPVFRQINGGKVVALAVYLVNLSLRHSHRHPNVLKGFKFSTVS